MVFGGCFDSVPGVVPIRRFFTGYRWSLEKLLPLRCTDVSLSRRQVYHDRACRGGHNCSAPCLRERNCDRVQVQHRLGPGRPIGSRYRGRRKERPWRVQSGPFQILNKSQRGQVGGQGGRQVRGQVDRPERRTNGGTRRPDPGPTGSVRPVKGRAFATKGRGSSLEVAPETRPCVNDRSADMLSLITDQVLSVCPEDAVLVVEARDLGALHQAICDDTAAASALLVQAVLCFERDYLEAFLLTPQTACAELPESHPLRKAFVSIAGSLEYRLG